MAAPKTTTIHKLRELHDLRVPMRDGVELATDVYMPASGGPFPVLVQRTPYDRGSLIPATVISAVYLAQRGFAVVLQDCRGRYDSDGEWYPFINEVNDGHDAIEWAAKQPWSDGKVGSIGASYLGLTQWQEAQGGSKHYIASVPFVAYSNTFHNWVYTGGAFHLAFNLNWSLTMATRTNRVHPLWLPGEIHLNSLLWHLPLITSDENAGRPSSTGRTGSTTRPTAITGVPCNRSRRTTRRPRCRPTAWRAGTTSSSRAASTTSSA